MPINILVGACDFDGAHRITLEVDFDLSSALRKDDHAIPACPVIDGSSKFLFVFMLVIVVASSE